MIKIQITGTTNYIKIRYDGKTVKAQGEMVVGGFVAYIKSMESWEEPNSDEYFDFEIRDKIIKEAIEYCKDMDFKVRFE